MSNLEDVLCSADLIRQALMARQKENPFLGECYVASALLYDLYDGENLTLVKKMDSVGVYHWWVVFDDGETHMDIDITKDQYHLRNLPCPSSSPEDCIISKKMGFASYKKRIKKLEEEVLEIAEALIATDTNTDAL